VVAVDRDDWVGLLTNRDPRTAIGVKHDGKVVLVTVDGRQPDTVWDYRRGSLQAIC